MRSLKILNELSPILSESSYAMLQHHIDSTFATIFNFRNSRILFKQPNGVNMYIINALSKEEYYTIAELGDYNE